MPKAERKRSNPNLKIEGMTFKDFEGLDRNKVIPFFNTVEKNKEEYQGMDEDEKPKYYELYYMMYSKYYDSLLEDKSLRDKFDPGVIFGYVNKDYYEGKGNQVDTKPAGIYKTASGTRVSHTTPTISRAAGGDNDTGSKSRKSKKRKSRKSKKRKSRKLKKSKSKRRSKK